jgi:hypothetical protein
MMNLRRVVNIQFTQPIAQKPVVPRDRLALDCFALNDCSHRTDLQVSLPSSTSEVPMHYCTSAAIIIALTSSLTACGGDKGSNVTTTGNPLSQLTSAVGQMEKMSKGMSEAAARKPVPPVSFKVLIDYLPKSLEGMKADDPKGQTTTAGEWQYSQAENHYRSEGNNKSAQVGLFDYAHIPMLYAPFQMIMNMKMSTESTEGYERSTTIGGFPAHEKWTKDGEENEVTILVADRFVVTTTTRGLGEDSAKKIAESIDLKGLAGKASS